MSLPNNIYNELIDGLTLIDNLSLSFAPSSLDDLQKAVAAWEWALCAKITWDAELDAGRITAAFNEIVPKIDKWPAPALVISHLPPRPLPPALPKPDAIPCPPHIAKKIAQLTGKLVK